MNGRLFTEEEVGGRQKGGREKLDLRYLCGICENLRAIFFCPVDSLQKKLGKGTGSSVLERINFHLRLVLRIKTFEHFFKLGVFYGFEVCRDGEIGIINLSF
ncbi:hypothetical protein BH11BAC7_BH11BAC7_03550 [soil metagenome]